MFLDGHKCIPTDLFFLHDKNLPLCSHNVTVEFYRDFGDMANIGNCNCPKGEEAKYFLSYCPIKSMLLLFRV